MAKKGYAAEAERKKNLEKEGYFVTRNSGSIGAGDIIAMKPVTDGAHLVFIEQVKKTRKKAYYFDEKSKDELRRLKEIYLKFKIDCFFSIKFTNRGWSRVHVSFIDNDKPKRIKYEELYRGPTIN
jgi:Holliday junction resolvase